MNIIFSTVGTSSITNQNVHAKKINELSNKREEELNIDEKNFIDGQIQERKQNALKFINNKQFNELKEFSAELNGILSYYQNNIDKNDYHILLSTDTYVCQKTSELIEDLLRNLGFVNIVIPKIKNLNTIDTENFTTGLKNLRNEIYQNYINHEGFKSYKKIFNLTGGFKSVNAFLNILGMFYADEIIYIFETKTNLIKIPKLPISIDRRVFIEYYNDFLYLCNEVNINGVEKTNIPEIFLFKTDNKYILNEWGEIMWDEVKKSIIIEKGLPEFENVNYEKNFKSQFSKLPEDEKVKVVLIISRASYLLKQKNNINDLRNDRVLQLNDETQNITQYKIEVEKNKRLFLNYEDKILKFQSYRKHEGNRYIEI